MYFIKIKSKKSFVFITNWSVRS